MKVSPLPPPLRRAYEDTSHHERIHNVAGLSWYAPPHLKSTHTQTHTHTHRPRLKLQSNQGQVCRENTHAHTVEIRCRTQQTHTHAHTRDVLQINAYTHTRTYRHTHAQHTHGCCSGSSSLQAGTPHASSGAEPRRRRLRSLAVSRPLHRR